MKLFKRNPCAECAFYVDANNTCQSKKAATSGYGYVSFFDRLFCKPYKPKDDFIDAEQTVIEAEE